MAKPTAKAASDAADQFFALKAAQAELAVKEERLKSVLMAYGKPVIEGKLARVTVSEVAGRESVDMAKLKAMLRPAELARVLKVGSPSIRIAAKARVSDASVAAK